VADADGPGDDRSPEDEFRDMLREILSGGAGVDPAQLAGAAGLPNDPASVAALFSQLQQAMTSGGDGINRDLALQQGVARANDGQQDTDAASRAAWEQAYHVAALWLDEAVAVSSLTDAPVLLSRRRWVEQTMPVWTQLAEPVASSIADSLTKVMSEQAPEELRGMMAGASQMMRSIGGTLFAMQLGQVVGQLSAEVVSGGDVGIPLLEDGTAAVLPQNAAEFGEGLDIPDDQVQLYLAVRELAHARLFRHARWLRLKLISSITDFARGIRIDTDRIEELASDFDPSNPEALRDALVNGSLIPPKTEEQQVALARLETMLALIEGWVDVVTARATERLPSSGAIAETIRRRRATGGPAESAFGTLVGLELRPRRLREAAAMWTAVTDAVGVAGRDDLWSHPDLLPSSADVDDPARIVARLTGERTDEEASEADAFDQALEALLRGETPGASDDAGSPDDEGSPDADRG